MPPHPTSDELSAFLLGKLPLEQCDEVASHIEACPPCQETLGQLESQSDTLLEIVRKRGEVLPIDSACQRAMQRAMTLVKGNADAPSITQSLANMAAEHDTTGAGPRAPVAPPASTEVSSPNFAALAESAQPQPPNTSQMVALIRAANILSDDDWTAIQGDIAASADGVTLLKRLFEQGTLTKFQAKQLYEGQPRGLNYGEYIVLDRIGAGGMGQVFKARHRRMDRLVALKVMASAAMKDQEAVKRFQREVKAAARLIHPHIVTAFDAGEHDGVHFLVMEFVDGHDLSGYIKQHGPLAVNEAVAVVLQAARGLAFAHAEGVVHRDIKPANLLRDKKGVVRILDMGLARFDDPLGRGQDDGLTQSGAVMGTVDYMAPEQAFNTRDAGPAADVYSLGCTLYRLLTGQSLYNGDTVVQKILAHREQPIPALTAGSEPAPSALTRLYERMVAKKMADRPTMAEVVTELEAIHKAATVGRAAADSAPRIVVAPQKAATAGRGGRGSHGGRRPPLKYLAAAAGAAALLFFGVWLIVRDKDGKTVAEIDAALGTKVHVPAGGSVEVATQPATPATPPGRQPGDSIASQTSPAQGSAPSSQAPPADYALRFQNGATVEVPTLSDAIDPTGPLTIECWLAPGYYLHGEAERPGSLLAKFAGEVPCLGAVGGPFYVCINNSGVFDFRLFPNEVLVGDGGAGKPPLTVAKQGEVGAKRVYVNGGFSSAAKQQPIHLACVRSQTKAQFYMAGKLIYSKDLPPVTLAKSEEPFRIGGKHNFEDVWFHGVINEVRLSRTVRYDKDFAPPTRFESDTDTVALYHFDEGTGDVLKDSSGNNHHGKIVGATWVRADGGMKTPSSPTTIVTSAPVPSGNNALHFDGRSAHVLIPTLSFDDNQEWTLEATATYDGPPDESGPKVFRLGGKTGMVFLNVGGRSDYFVKAFHVGSGIAYRSELSIPQIRKTRFAVTARKQEVHLYVNGRRNSHAAALQRSGNLFPHGLLIGGDPPDPKLFFPGTIDEVRVSKIVRYNGDYVPLDRLETDADTVALYHFDEGTGDVLRDASGNNHHGKIVGATWVRADGSAITASQLVGPQPPLAVAPFDAKQARAHQEAWAKHLGTEVETLNSIGQKMILVPAGEFLMGSSDEQIATARAMIDAKIDIDRGIIERVEEGERPQHKVVLTKPFQMSATEVTVAQFREFVQATKYMTEAEQYGFGGSASKTVDASVTEEKKKSNWRSPGYAFTDDSPVSQITWTDATAFCQWLSAQEKRAYRLPTEAEWEYACRAGTKTLYSFGDDASLLERYGWYLKELGAGPHAVAGKLTNAFGLFDMHGNLQEWCGDGYDLKWYAQSPPHDPWGPSSNLRRVIRGGLRQSTAVRCRSAYRNDGPVSLRDINLGFRVVAEIAMTSSKGAVASANVVVTPTTTPGRQPGDNIASPTSSARWNTPAFQQWLAATQKLPAEQQLAEFSKKLMELNPGFDGKLSGGYGQANPVIDKGVVTGVGFSTVKVNNISPVRLFTDLTDLGCNGEALPNTGALTDLSPLQGLRLKTLMCGKNRITDLSPLQGMPLLRLEAFANPLGDISALQGMPLNDLNLNNTSYVNDISPLRGMPLRHFGANSLKATDLSPLAGLPLEGLTLRGAAATDLSPLKNCTGLKTLELTLFRGSPDEIVNLQQALPKCKIDWDDPSKSPGGKPGDNIASPKKLAYLDPAFQQWLVATQKLPAEQQLAEFSKKLMELNPGFDGKLVGSYESGSSKPSIENGVVTGVGFDTAKVADISPVRVFSGLRALNTRANPRPNGWGPKGPLVDLSPLAGMQLTSLHVGNVPVVDLSPIRGMQLKSLGIYTTDVSDLSPLVGMPLEVLAMNYANKVTDLRPLRGMPLKNLGMNGLPIADLSPLAGVQLDKLSIASTQVTDISVLRRMPLRWIDLAGTKVTDLAPLRDCPKLEQVLLSNVNIAPAEISKLLQALPECKVEFSTPSGLLPTTDALQEVDPERRVARWVLARGGTVNVSRASDERSRTIALEKDLPAEPFLVVHLKVPGSSNEISAAEWQSLAGLRFVRSIDVSGCRPTNEALAAIGRCRSLENLILAFHQSFNDAGIRHLVDLPHLRVLDLSGGGQTAASLESLGKLTSLRQLKMGTKDLQVTTLKPLQSLVQLQQLDLNGAKISDQAVGELAALPQLRLMNLSGSGSGLTPAVIDQLLKLRGLYAVSIEGLRLPAAALLKLADHPTLTLINTYGSGIKPEEYEQLAKALPRLTFLHPELQTLNAAELAAIDWAATISGPYTGYDRQLREKAPHNAELNFHVVKAFSPVEVRQLSKVKNLTRLILWEKGASDEPVRSVFESLREFPHLLSLWIDKAQFKDAASLTDLTRHVGLSSFELTSSDGVGDASLAPLAKLPHLARVKLESSQLTDGAFEHLKPLQELELLSVLRAQQITGNRLSELRDKPRLWNLQLSKTGVTDAALAALVELPALEELSLDRTTISDVGLAHLAGCRNLRVLNVYGTKVTPAGIAALRKALPDCMVWHDSGIIPASAAKAERHVLESAPIRP